MCKHGNTKGLKINGKIRDIDECIYDLVKVLNETGMETVACCCGHGKQPVRISILNGKDENGLIKSKELFIFKDYETGQKISGLFPPISPYRKSKFSNNYFMFRNKVRAIYKLLRKEI